MNRDDVIRMASKAGFDYSDTELTWESVICTEELELFAALVAAAEREKVAAWMIQRGYATGHGDTTEDLLNELDWQVLANWSSAMKTGTQNEREACAKLCEAQEYEYWRSSEEQDFTPQDCANAIRARGQA